MTIQQYIDALNKRYKLANATEHTFRGDLQQLIETITPEISATNEPKRIACGAPDYVLMRKEIPVGFIEAKDINDKDLEGKKITGNKNQFDRYKSSLNNLIFTDYLDFHFYLDGVFKTSVRIAEVHENEIVGLTKNYNEFTNLIQDFTKNISQTIKSSQRLAELMAGKARLLADIIEKSLIEDLADNLNPETELEQQMKAFKDVLIHDITPKQFADVYSQTIAYGMFAARLHDPTLPTFSREEAAQLIPKSNPFLRKLFQFIAGYDLDTRIRWVVDSLVEIFLACNVEQLLKNYGKSTQMNDPIIHFYETFLSEYDASLRKQRGVWYTPAPVVNFIVRAVDEVLKTEFGLAQGLADTSKIKVKRKHITKSTADQRSKNKEVETEEEVHRVQILDPATGTGTFLAEVIKHIHKKFKGQEGIWSSYVENNLIPRLNGFELLMASYAMAHLQLDLLLTETGFKPTKEQRLRVYLTNSLEEYHQDTGTLFANWLSTEANEANHIKRDTPVMCVIGNPPYSGESFNKGEWIMNLMEDYKKEPGGKEKLKERNPKSINADEYKFIRYAEHFIEKNESGVLAFINPHSFLDSPVFRGMRWHLLRSFDKVYILDLHGNSTKKETNIDGSNDQNVFNIMQGVSINIFVKNGKKLNADLGKVFQKDVYGKREIKFDFLTSNSINSIDWKEISTAGPNYPFIHRDFTSLSEYEKGFRVDKLYLIKSSGVKTHDDSNLIGSNLIELKLKIEKKGIQFDEDKVKKYAYRPFDNDFIYYDTKILGRAREKTIYHLLYENLGLKLVSQPQAANLNFFDCVFIANKLTDTNMFRRGGPVVFPLYLYSETTNQQTIEPTQTRLPNLNKEIVVQIAKGLDLTFENEKTNERGTFAPIDLLDYIYAVLHSPNYRDTYKEFLKIDFPRVPYPTDTTNFWKLVKLGGELRQIHLLESETVENYITTYPKSGNNMITRKLAQKDWELFDIENQLGRIWINDEQYFDKIPLTAWEFYIGGYQPAQKWLKDRRERELSFEDILHYQKIIVALTETSRIMGEIDKVFVI
nr:type ISP restriction/modification enzyme [uncultured Fluviicola sp.]